MRATKIPPPPPPESVNNIRTSFVYPAGFTQVFCEYSSLPRAMSPVQCPQDWGHQALTCPEWSQRAVSPQRFPSCNRGSFVKLTLRAVFPPGLIESHFSWIIHTLKKTRIFLFTLKLTAVLCSHKTTPPQLLSLAVRCLCNGKLLQVRKTVPPRPPLAPVSTAYHLRGDCVCAILNNPTNKSVRLLGL